MSKMVQIVIFGASGDLTARKLIPALFHSFCNQFFTDPIQIVGVARRSWDQEIFRQQLKSKIDLSLLDPKSSSKRYWTQFIQKINYFQIDLSDGQKYFQLADYLREIANGTCQRIFYLAIKPDLFLPTVTGLSKAGLLEKKDGISARVVIEKPFGNNLASAKKLNLELSNLINEKQLYRIDHYLGKETVQNILAFRFRNAFVEPLWNQRYVKLVQISVCESSLVGERAGYYDSSGALRDMVQNHLLQLIALVAMEAPASLEGDAIRNEKVKVLEGLRCPTTMGRPEQHVIKGQYNGYLSEKGVEKDSTTENYIACRTYIDNWRWGGVPFVIRTGKGLRHRFTSITIHFVMPPHNLFGSWQHKQTQPNNITLRIQPQEGIDISFDVKEPSSPQTMRSAKLSFEYEEFFEHPTPDAYQRLLQDVILGDQSLFIRSDEVEACWVWADSLRNMMNSQPLYNYETGSWGPDISNTLFGDEAFSWIVSVN